MTLHALKHNADWFSWHSLKISVLLGELKNVSGGRMTGFRGCSYTHPLTQCFPHFVLAILSNLGWKLV